MLPPAAACRACEISVAGDAGVRPAAHDRHCSSRDTGNKGGFRASLASLTVRGRPAGEIRRCRRARPQPRGDALGERTDDVALGLAVSCRRGDQPRVGLSPEVPGVGGHADRTAGLAAHAELRVRAERLAPHVRREGIRTIFTRRSTVDPQPSSRSGGLHVHSVSRPKSLQGKTLGVLKILHRQAPNELGIRTDRQRGGAGMGPGGAGSWKRKGATWSGAPPRAHLWFVTA